MIFEKDAILKRWSEYVEDLFSDDRPAPPTPSNDRGPPILKDEVRKAIENTRLGKATGDDEVTTEMLKILEELGVEKSTELYNEIYESGSFPEELLMSVFITLPKQSRATDCSNFRTISLMPHTFKIFLKIAIIYWRRSTLKLIKSYIHVSSTILKHSIVYIITS